jgi:hypothetical protein
MLARRAPRAAAAVKAVWLPAFASGCRCAAKWRCGRRTWRARWEGVVAIAALLAENETMTPTRSTGGAGLQ